MDSFTFELDHIGIAVDDLDQAGSFYEALGLRETSRESVPTESVKVGFFPLKNSSNIELLEAMTEESPIAKFISKKGPGIHHICLRVKNLDGLVKQLLIKKVQLINEVPRIGAHNCRVVFVHPKATGGVLIELSEQQGEH